MKKRFFLVGMTLFAVFGLYLRGVTKDNLNKNTEFILEFKGKSVPISRGGFELSRILKGALEEHFDEEYSDKKKVFDEKANRVLIRLNPFFKKVSWGGNVELQDIRKFAQLSDKLYEASLLTKPDLRELEKLTDEQLSRLIMLADFFDTTQGRGEKGYNILELLIGLLAKKIKPKMNAQNYKVFFADKKNIFSELIDGMPNELLSILKKKLFAEKKDITSTVFVDNLGRMGEGFFRAFALGVLSDGMLVAFAEVSQFLVIDPYTGKLVDRGNFGSDYPPFAVIGNKIITFSPSSEVLGSAHVRNVDGEILLKIPMNKPTAFAAFQDGKRLAAILPEHIKIWNIEMGKELKSLKVPENRQPHFLGVLSGERLVVGDENGVIQIWDIEAEEVQKELIRKNSPDLKLKSLAVLPYEMLAALYDDGEFLIWDIKAGRKLKNLGKFNFLDYKASLVMLPWGKLVFSDGEELEKWDIFSLFEVFKGLSFEQAMLVDYLRLQGEKGKRVQRTRKVKEVYNGLPERKKKGIESISLTGLNKKAELFKAETLDPKDMSQWFPIPTKKSVGTLDPEDETLWFPISTKGEN